MIPLVRKSILLTVTMFYFLVVVVAQDAVPQEILNRTLFIKAGNEFGTAFLVDHKDKLYLVTARHVVAELPASNATIQISRSGKWTDYHIPKILFPPSNHADIAVMETGEKAAQPYNIAISQVGGPALGQQMWFLGYPFGLHSRADNAELPFIKRAMMSAVDSTDHNAVVIYMDGFNNPGFSGGPIVYWNFNEHAYRVFGVVQGYKEDTAKVLINGKHVDTQLLVNTGILVGYSIEHVIQAIGPPKP